MLLPLIKKHQPETGRDGHKYLPELHAFVSDVSAGSLTITESAALKSIRATGVDSRNFLATEKRLTDKNVELLLIICKMMTVFTGKL